MFCIFSNPLSQFPNRKYSLQRRMRCHFFMKRNKCIHDARYVICESFITISRKKHLFFLSELLERVLFRLGTADSDEQLESAVNKFLTPVLLKITSSNESVRCKV